MDNGLNNIDDLFRNSLESWDAPHSASEMGADWSNVSAHIPTSPVQTPSHIGWSAGKIAGIAGISGAVITGAVLLLNTLSKSPEKPDAEKQISKTEAPTVKEQVTPPGTTHFNGGPATVTAPGGVQLKNEKHENSEKLNTGNKKFSTSTIPDNSIVQQPVNQTPVVNTGGNNPIPEKRSPSSISIIKQNLKISSTVVCLGNGTSLRVPGLNGTPVKVEWGDGTAENINRDEIIHYFKQPGRYDVRISDGSDGLVQKIQVIDAPQAHFMITSCDRMSCRFRNLSEGAVRYAWNFGDRSGWINEESPEHHFSDTGSYTVTLAATGDGGCVDTSVQKIYVSTHKKPSVPNVISPDGDGKNDELVVDISDETYFELIILNSSSHIVFQSKDKNHHWTGLDEITGNPAPAGTYYYLLQFRYKDESSVQKESGFLTLIR